MHAFVLVSFLTLSSAAFAQESTATAPQKSLPTSGPSLGRSAISAELLGRAGVYSFNYDYNFIPNLAAGLGVSFWSQSTGTATGTVTLIPVYLNAYLWTGKHRPFVTAGATLGRASVSDESSSSESNANFLSLGAGYEMRTEAGFLMRLAGYRMTSPEGSSGFWPGVSFGGSF